MNKPRGWQSLGFGVCVRASFVGWLPALRVQIILTCSPSLVPLYNPPFIRGEIKGVRTRGQMCGDIKVPGLEFG